MSIAAYRKFTLLDYPKKLSSIVFFSGCNLSCPYCHNKELIKKIKPKIKIRDIIDDLKNKSGWLDGVVITGGEPCYSDKELIKLLKQIKKYTNLKIKLDTNGTYPDILESLILKKMINYIAMDIKNAYFLDDKKIQKSIRIIKSNDNQIDYEFRTTVYPIWIDEKVIEQICKNIFGAQKYVLQQYKKVEGLKIEPYNKEKLFIFKKIAEKYIKECEIKNI